MDCRSLQAFDEPPFIAGPRKDQPLPAVLQCGQAHGCIREQRQQLRIGEASFGNNWRLRCGSKRRWLAADCLPERECDHGDDYHRRQAAERQTSPTPLAKDERTGKQGGFPATITLFIQQIAKEMSLLRCHGREFA